MHEFGACVGGIVGIVYFAKSMIDDGMCCAKGLIRRSGGSILMSGFSLYHISAGV